MNIQVSFEEVRVSGMALRENAASYEELINRICARCTEIGQVWQGQDARAFIAQMEVLRPRLAEMKRVIDSYASVLESSATAYENLQNNRAACARMLG